MRGSSFFVDQEHHRGANQENGDRQEDQRSYVGEARPRGGGAASRSLKGIEHGRSLGPRGPEPSYAFFVRLEQKKIVFYRLSM